MAFHLAGFPTASAVGSTLEIKDGVDFVRLFDSDGGVLPNPVPVRNNGLFPTVFVEDDMNVSVSVRDINGNIVWTAIVNSVHLLDLQQEGVSEERFEALKLFLDRKEYGIAGGGTGATTRAGALTKLTENLDAARLATGIEYNRTTAPDGTDITDLDQLTEEGVYKLPGNYDQIANVPDLPKYSNEVESFVDESESVYVLVSPRGLYGLVQKVFYFKWGRKPAVFPKFWARYAYPDDDDDTNRGDWSAWYGWGLVYEPLTANFPPTTTSINTDAILVTGTRRFSYLPPFQQVDFPDNEGDGVRTSPRPFVECYPAQEITHVSDLPADFDLRSWMVAL